MSQLTRVLRRVSTDIVARLQPRPRRFHVAVPVVAHRRGVARGALGRVWRFPARLRKDGPQSREDRRAQGERRGDPPEALRKVRQAHREGGEGRRVGPRTRRRGRAALAKVLADASRLRVLDELLDGCRAKPEQRATDGSVSATDYAELTYEAYGAGGVGVVIEALSDNANRAAADVKTTVNKWGGKLAAPGGVLFNFERRGIIVVRTGRESGTDRDAASRSFERVFEIAVENGGVDVAEMEERGGRGASRSAHRRGRVCAMSKSARGFWVRRGRGRVRARDGASVESRSAGLRGGKGERNARGEAPGTR